MSPTRIYVNEIAVTGNQIAIVKLRSLLSLSLVAYLFSRNLKWSYDDCPSRVLMLGGYTNLVYVLLLQLAFKLSAKKTCFSKICQVCFRKSLQIFIGPDITCNSFGESALFPGFVVQTSQVDFVAKRLWAWLKNRPEEIISWFHLP